ncbi:MAG TPA: NAD(P)H-binding protein [Microbacterium sp.]|nr:NAD(P)H-binding protein [Microbacterium sp.]
MAAITVIGGTGFAGSHIAAAAQRRGNDVTVISRTAAAEPLPGVTYIQADASGSVPAAVSSADVVVGALSPRAGSEGTLVSTYRSIAAAAAAAGAGLIVIGGFGSLRPAAGAPRFADSGGLPPEFAAEATELNQVRESLTVDAPAGLSWAFVSPGAAFGAYVPAQEPRGEYRTSGDVALFDERGDSSIGGEDFATAVVDLIDDGDLPNGHVHFAY